MTAEEAGDWGRETLAPVFAAGDVTVLVPGHVASYEADHPVAGGRAVG